MIFGCGKQTPDDDDIMMINSSDRKATQYYSSMTNSDNETNDPTMKCR